MWALGRTWGWGKARFWGRQSGRKTFVDRVPNFTKLNESFIYYTVFHNIYQIINSNKISKSFYIPFPHYLTNGWAFFISTLHSFIRYGLIRRSWHLWSIWCIFIGVWVYWWIYWLDCISACYVIKIVIACHLFWLFWVLLLYLWCNGIVRTML